MRQRYDREAHPRGDRVPNQEDSRLLSPLEKRIIHSLQEDLPVVSRPFALVAARHGISEAELIGKIREFVSTGMIRRFGATLRHQHSGFEANAMVVWQVEEERIEEVGGILASFREVTHCYQRRTAPDWPYRLFTMIHGRSRDECRRLARRMAETTGVESYRLLFTTEELKKTTPAYFGHLEAR
jgi:DNA-binding Lrp family transcriptional regulator